MGPYKAFIFDLNGTMIDDMEYHSIAWFNILNNDLKAGLSRAEVKREMYGKNGNCWIVYLGRGILRRRKSMLFPGRRKPAIRRLFVHTCNLSPGCLSF